MDSNDLCRYFEQINSCDLSESLGIASRLTRTFKELGGWYEMEGISLEQKTPRLKSLCQGCGEIDYPITLEGKVHLTSENLVNVFIPEQLHAPQTYPVTIFPRGQEKPFAEDSIKLKINWTYFFNQRIEIMGKYYLAKSEDGLNLRLQKGD